MKCLIEPHATCISSEDAAGPVAAVGTGCKAHKKQRGRRVTKSRNWTAPVHLRGKFPLPLNSDIAAVAAQPWAEATGDYLLIQLLQGISHDF
jgi:hypothetical protein